jgi:hypothetical protein
MSELKMELRESIIASLGDRHALIQREGTSAARKCRVPEDRGLGRRDLRYVDTGDEEHAHSRPLDRGRGRGLIFTFRSLLLARSQSVVSWGCSRAFG